MPVRSARARRAPAASGSDQCSANRAPHRGHTADRLPETPGQSDRRESSAMAKEILCAYGVDVDAVAGWLGSYAGEDSPDDISRGLFAGEVGSPRLLKLFARYDMTVTWFIPGHSIETFPEQMKAVADAGHEIGVHGYSHENPIAMTEEQETAVLLHSIDLVQGSPASARPATSRRGGSSRTSRTGCCSRTASSTTTASCTTTSTRTTSAWATSGRRSTTASRPRSG